MYCGGSRASVTSSRYTFEPEKRVCEKFVDGEYPTLDACISANTNSFTANCSGASCSIDTTGRGAYPSLSVCTGSCPPKQCDQTVSPDLCLFDFPAGQTYTRVDPAQLFPDVSGARSVMITPSFDIPRDAVMSVYVNPNIGIEFPLSVDLVWDCNKLSKPYVTVSLALKNMVTGENVSTVTNTIPFDGRVGTTCDYSDTTNSFPFPLTTMLPTDWKAHVTAGPHAWFLLLQTSQAMTSSFYYAVNHIRIGTNAAKSSCRFVVLYDTPSAAVGKKAAKLRKQAEKHQRRAHYHRQKAQQLMDSLSRAFQ
jgi:hypothetical protein